MDNQKSLSGGIIFLIMGLSILVGWLGGAKLHEQAPAMLRLREDQIFIDNTADFAEHRHRHRSPQASTLVVATNTARL